MDASQPRLLIDLHQRFMIEKQKNVWLVFSAVSHPVLPGEFVFVGKVDHVED